MMAEVIDFAKSIRELVPHPDTMYIPPCDRETYERRMPARWFDERKMPTWEEIVAKNAELKGAATVKALEPVHPTAEERIALLEADVALIKGTLKL